MTKRPKPIFYIALFFLTQCLLTACGTMGSPLERAYYSEGGGFSLPGGYNRTIFSSTYF